MCGVVVERERGSFLFWKWVRRARSLLDFWKDGGFVFMFAFTFAVGGEYGRPFVRARLESVWW